MSGLSGVAFRTISSGLSRRCHRQTPCLVKHLSTAAPSGIGNSSESIEDFEQRMFNGPSTGSFFDKLDKAQKFRQTPGSRPNEGNSFDIMDGLDESLSSLSDGIEGKLKKKAMYFDFDINESQEPGFTFRPDMNFQWGSTYEPKDLDLRKPGIRKPFKRPEFQVTTEEALKFADFRNVRFLANFITEAGILIKRSKTGISAKAQRKIAREIKTARAFGLMPFTTMGTKSFVFGRTMQRLDSDFEYRSYNDNVLDEEEGEEGN